MGICPECGKQKHLIRAHLYTSIESAEKGTGGYYTKMCQRCSDAIPEFE